MKISFEIDANIDREAIEYFCEMATRLQLATLSVVSINEILLRDIEEISFRFTDVNLTIKMERRAPFTIIVSKRMPDGSAKKYKRFFNYTDNSIQQHFQPILTTFLFSIC